MARKLVLSGGRKLTETDDFTPTPEQQSIIEATSGPDSLMVRAYAGAAKTTTLQLAAPRVKVPALALAFNKKIAEELKPRLPGQFTVKTLNGLGHQAWCRALEGRGSVKLDDRKLGKLVTEVSKGARAELSGGQWDQLRQLVSAAMQVGLVPRDEGVNCLSSDTPETWAELTSQIWIDRDDQGMMIELAREVLLESNKLARQGVISFDDQVYCPVVLGGAWPQFPVLFVDEAQDLNPLQHEMVRLSSRPDAKLLVVGDPKQCHPEGTRILLANNKGERNIEEIQVGDQVVSLEINHAWFCGTGPARTKADSGIKVINKSEFYFKGELIGINSTDGNHFHECTPNHKCLVKMEENDKYCVYMMRKGDSFRIGTAKAFYGKGFGPIQRAQDEGAEDLWILLVTDSKTESLVEEKLICAEFGLIDITFASNSDAHIPQHILDRIWSRIGDCSARAKKCLEIFRRDLENPFWSKTDSGYGFSKRGSIMQARNLINDIMSIRIFDGNIRGVEWRKIVISHRKFDGKVYGIEVEPVNDGKRLYIANGIVTHNSIYGFRGADYKSMDTMTKLRPEWLRLPLATTFRCPKAVVARQQDHAPGFTAWHTNIEGRVEVFEGGEGKGWNWERLRGISPEPAQIAVLCRNNAPLMSLAFKLIRRGIGPIMLGRDIGKGLVGLTKKIASRDDISAELVMGALRDWEDRELGLARANQAPDSKLESIQDKAECVRAVLEGSDCRDAGELRAMLTRLFARIGGQVTLSSIHRAKGLEWPVVMHLDPWRIPSKAAKAAAKRGDESGLEQEWNLKYVAETRTKDVLVLANLEDFR